MPFFPIIKDFLAFLDGSPTPWHAVATAVERLHASHFLELSEWERWSIRPGERYVVQRHGSSLCAFVAPHRAPRRIRLLASHTDSPGLKLKPHSETRQHHAIVLGVEVYGSPLLNSWLNRDLGIAGRMWYTDRVQKVQEKLVRLDRYPVMIPQLALHLDREVNERGLCLNKQEHLNALAGLDNALHPAPFLEGLLRGEADVEEILSHDLFLFPLEGARLIGEGHSLLAAHRIDSLASLHAALTALLQNADPLEDEIKMMMAWDHEEIGSHTAQGAYSPFFNQVVERIVESFNGSREDYFCLLNRSTAMSIDLAHALHPNHSDKHDPQHRPFLGRGVVIKYNAQGRYATSARTVLPVQMAASLKKLPLQPFVSRNDIPCGSTIGPIQATLTGMPAVDLGCGQLSMHSCRELMACQDHLDLCELLSTLLQMSDWP